MPAGQSTQMIVGATGESDYQIISVAEAMYNRFDMKRVFYSAFVNVNMDESLPGITAATVKERAQALSGRFSYEILWF